MTSFKGLGIKREGRKAEDGDLKLRQSSDGSASTAFNLQPFTDHHALPSPPQPSQHFYNAGRSGTTPRSYLPLEDSVESRSPRMNIDSPHRADHSHLESSYGNQSSLLHHSRNHSTSNPPSGLLLSMPQRSRYSPDHPLLHRPRIASLSHDNSSQVSDNSFSRRYSHASNQVSDSNPQHQSSLNSSAQSFGSGAWRTTFNQPPQIPSDRLRFDASAALMRPPLLSPNRTLSPGSHPNGNETSDYFATSKTTNSAGSDPSQVASLPPVQTNSKSSTNTNSSPKTKKGGEAGSEGQELQLRKRLRVSPASIEYFLCCSSLLCLKLISSPFLCSHPYRSVERAMNVVDVRPSATSS